MRVVVNILTREEAAALEAAAADAGLHFIEQRDGSFTLTPTPQTLKPKTFADLFPAFIPYTRS